MEPLRPEAGPPEQTGDPFWFFGTCGPIRHEECDQEKEKSRNIGTLGVLRFEHALQPTVKADPADATPPATSQQARPRQWRPAAKSSGHSEQLS
jgi:hypothetical protein